MYRQNRNTAKVMSLNLQFAIIKLLNNIQNPIEQKLQILYKQKTNNPSHSVILQISMQPQQSPLQSLLPFSQNLPQQLLPIYANLFTTTKHSLKQSNQISKSEIDSNSNNPKNQFSIENLSPLHIQQRILLIDSSFASNEGQWCLSDFVESEYLHLLKKEDNSESMAQYYEIKSNVIKTLYQLVDSFELNSKFLCETPIRYRNQLGKNSNQEQKLSQQLPEQSLSNRHFIPYLIEQIYRTFSTQSPPPTKLNPSQKPSSLSLALTTYRNQLTSLYYLIVKSNSIPVSHLQTITQHLCDFYYKGAAFRYIKSSTDTQEEQKKQLDEYLQKIKLEKKMYLSEQLIETSFRLLEAGVQERLIQPFLYFVRSGKESSSNNNSGNVSQKKIGQTNKTSVKSEDEVRLIFHNPKWIFNKGMTLWIWLNSMAKKDLEEKQERIGQYNGFCLMCLKTDQNHKLEINLLRNYDMEIVINASGYKKDQKTFKIPQKDHRINPNELTLIGIELDAQQTSTGFFGKSSTIYTLKIKSNNHSIPTPLLPPSASLPKFTPNDYITEFSLCQNLIGSIYSIIVTNRPQLMSAHDKLSPTCAYHKNDYSSFYGPCNEKYVWELIFADILNKQNIVVIFNAERTIEGGVLVNYVGEKNIGCFKGEISKEKYSRYDFQVAEVFMPYLYMVVCQREMVNSKQGDKQISEQVSSQKQKQLQKSAPLFDLIVKQIINLSSSNNQSQIYIQTNSGIFAQESSTNPNIANTNNGPSLLNSSENENILFLLYFLELSHYPISQSTLSYLVEQIISSSSDKKKIKSYFTIIGKFLNVPLLLQKGLKLSVTQEKQALEEHFEGYDINPVEKIQLLFYLETKWKEKWDLYQGFYGWWAPRSFLRQSQNDKRFNYEDYVYREAQSEINSLNKQDSQQQQQSIHLSLSSSNDPSPTTKFQWEVKNFITQDFTKCILKPTFEIPIQYEDLLQTYQKQYTQKQCMLEAFRLQLNFHNKRNIIKIRKYDSSGSSGGALLSRFKKKIMGDKKDSTDTTNLKSQNESLSAVKNRKRDILFNRLNPKKPPNSLDPSYNEQNPQQQLFSSQCLLIDLLSVTISHLQITNDGFLIISSQHHSNKFDHLCVRANKNQTFQYICFSIDDIKYIRKRRFNQSNRTIEIRKKDGTIYLLYFYMKNLESFIYLLSNYVSIRKDPYAEYLDSKEPERWIEKTLSNYEYILWLNDVAGRNFLDISQYPVMPWVFVGNQHAALLQQTSSSSKVQSKSLESKSHHYRNLSKNMGSHGDQQRLKHFLEKYSSNNEQQLFNEYHFGTHYSSSAIIFNYLIRVRPFSTGAITLQSGKFDCADRVFWSYVGSWKNATTSPTDIRELIPQVYSLPEMFLNVNNYDFGLTQDKERIDNVEIPKWSQKNPYKFVAMLRKQLQNSYTSQNINYWIDLIFGNKQRGTEAVNHMNIFFPLTYEDAINLDSIEDQQERISFETQIAHFGQNPAQIIGNNPHPIRMKKGQSYWQGKLIADGGAGIKIQRCNLDNSTKGKASNDSSSSSSLSPSSIPSSLSTQKFLYKSPFQPNSSIMSITFTQKNQFIVIKKHQYLVFNIYTNNNTKKKSNNDFITKQQQINYELETTEISLNYKEISSQNIRYIPTCTIYGNIVLIGGFYNSYVHFIFIDEPKCNQAVKFTTFNQNIVKTMSNSTVTGLVFSNMYGMLYLVDNEGYLKVYELGNSGGGTGNSSGGSSDGNNVPTALISSKKQLQFQQTHYSKIHDKRINQIVLNEKASLYLTCSDDGFVKMFNAYTNELIRFYRNPVLHSQNGTGPAPIIYCQLSICPLYAVVFYSAQDRMIYSYSINGQFLEKKLIMSTGAIVSGNVCGSQENVQSPNKQSITTSNNPSPLASQQRDNISLHGMITMAACDTTEKLVYLNASREIHIVQMPFLQHVRKIKLKKTDAQGKLITNNAITCFTGCQQTSKMCLIGTEDGGVQIISDPQAY